MWSSSLLAFLVVFSLGDGVLVSDSLSIEASVSEPQDGLCDVALDITDLGDGTTTFVVSQDDPLAGVSLLLPSAIPGAESGICSSEGPAEVCTYGWSDDESIDWAVDVMVPFGQTTLHIIDTSVVPSAVVADVGVGCTCHEWGDFDADGEIATMDLILLLGNYSLDVGDGPNAYLEAPESLTGQPRDGVVGPADLTAFLGRFGDNCD